MAIRVAPCDVTDEVSYCSAIEDAGAGALTVDGRVLAVRGAKPLPASD